MSLPDRRNLAVSTKDLENEVLDALMENLELDPDFPEEVIRTVLKCAASPFPVWEEEFDAFCEAVRTYGFIEGEKVSDEELDNLDFCRGMINTLSNREEELRIRRLSIEYAQELLQDDLVHEAMEKLGVQTDVSIVKGLLADLAIGGDEYLLTDDNEVLEDIGISIDYLNKLADIYHAG